MRQTSADPKLLRLNIALFSALGLTLCLVLGIAVWGVSRDFYQLRGTFIDSESDRIRSHAERTVATLASMLEAQSREPDIRASEFVRFLRTRWQTSVSKDDSRLYGAVITLDNEIAVHSEPKREGQKLEAIWYDHIVLEAGQDAVETKSSELTGGARSLDIRTPIVAHGKVIGSYHSGISFDWIEDELAAKKRMLWTNWSWILGAMLLALVVMSFGLVQINRRIMMLREYVKFLRVRRFTEVGQLMAGVVHEIRNPLSALRLNLHVTEGFIKNLNRWNESEIMSTAEQQEIVTESIQEIERMEGLLRMLLGYVRPEAPRPQPIDIRREIESTLNFLRPILERAEVAVTARFTDVPAIIDMDRDRFRQVVINLLNNSIDAIGKGGQIQISVRARREDVEIVFADDGPGVPPGDRERIFEPFYSTKEHGNGLGLAIIRRYIEDVGAVITCLANEPRGVQFVMRFPADMSDEFELNPIEGLSPS